MERRVDAAPFEQSGEGVRTPATPATPTAPAATARSSRAAPPRGVPLLAAPAALVVFFFSVLSRVLDGQHLRSSRTGGTGSELHLWPDNGTLENYASMILGQTRAPFVPALLNSAADRAHHRDRRARLRFPRGARRDAASVSGLASFIAYDPDRADDSRRGDDHLDLPARSNGWQAAQPDHRPLGGLHRDRAALHDLDAAGLRQRRAGRTGRGRR